MAYLDCRHGANVLDNHSDGRGLGKSGSGGGDIFDSLPYAAEHWSRHYLIFYASGESSRFIAVSRKRASQLLEKMAFLEYWKATQQAGTRPFAPLPGETTPPSPISVAAQLGLKYIVQGFLPSLGSERHAGLVAASRNEHHETVQQLLRPARGCCRPDRVIIVEAAKEAGA